MNIRRSQERGQFKNEWLHSFHSFSFADYFDREHMHFSDLRVINHDFIAPSAGFSSHPHKDMEIITYVLRGTVEHEDSLGNKAQIQAGEVQIMGAGTGVLHSEKNPSPTAALELLQIWITPKQKGGSPHYAQKMFNIRHQPGLLTTIVSPQGSEGSLPIRQDVTIYAGNLEAQQQLSAPLSSNRKYWLQVANGDLRFENTSLKKGDAVCWQAGEFSQLQIVASEQSEFLLFDLRSED